MTALLEGSKKTDKIMVLPSPWREISPRDTSIPDEFSSKIRAYVRGNGMGLRVLTGIEPHTDGKTWLHISISRPKRNPSWEDIKEVKDIFIGRDKEAVQVLPPQEEYVNLHEYCFHLWHCLEGRVAPTMM